MTRAARNTGDDRPANDGRAAAAQARQRKAEALVVIALALLTNVLGSAEDRRAQRTLDRII